MTRSDTRSDTRFDNVILDVDGTLVDSVEQHARAWSEALAEGGVDASVERLRPLIGMQGPRLLPELGVDPDSELGRRADERSTEIFLERHLPTVEPFAGARELLETLRARGRRLVIASSAPAEVLEPLLRLVGAEELMGERPEAEDARSKPAPDQVLAALERFGLDPERTVMLGDTLWDVRAANGAGVAAVALRCGGWPEGLDEALAVYDDPAQLLERLEESPLA